MIDAKIDVSRRWVQLPFIQAHPPGTDRSPQLVTTIQTTKSSGPHHLPSRTRETFVKFDAPPSNSGRVAHVYTRKAMASPI